MDKVIAVHNFDQAVAAISAAKELGVEVMLQNPPNSHAYAGIAYISALFQEVEKEIGDVGVSYVFDAGGDAALAIEAIDNGWKYLRFSGEEELRKKIENIADQYGVRVLLGVESLDLHGIVDSFQACKEWLQVDKNSNK